MIYANMDRPPLKWKGIVIHCSATDIISENNFQSIYFLHTSPVYRKFWWGEYATHGRSYSDIGYNYVVETTGVVKEGRPLHLAGAHTTGFNSKYIGICVCGNNDFNGSQFKAMNKLIDDLKETYGIPEEEIRPHNYFNPIKTCPNFDLEKIRREWNEQLESSKAEQERAKGNQSVSEKES